MVRNKITRFQQLKGLISHTNQFKEGKLINPTEISRIVGTSPSWAARVLRSLGWTEYWMIGRRKFYRRGDEW